MSVLQSINRQTIQELAERPELPQKTHFPPHTFTLAKKHEGDVRLPQAIAHRGYKDKFPENSMGAFKGAVEIGAQAIETDVHLSRDGIVVLSHDPTLKRCFGKPDRIIDCDWEYLQTLETLREPRQRLPSLKQLLEYLASPGVENVWLLLDIKIDNDANEIMRRIAETIAAVPPSEGHPWSSRVVLGCWAMKYLPLCEKYLPGFPISHICFSTLYATPMLAVPHVGFNMFLPILMTPWGQQFLRTAHHRQRPVFAWTVNDETRMRWGIQHGLDGIVTDDPKKFLEIRDAVAKGGVQRKVKLSWSFWWEVLQFNVIAYLFAVYILRRPFPSMMRDFIRRTGEAQEQ